MFGLNTGLLSWSRALLVNYVKLLDLLYKTAACYVVQGRSVLWLVMCIAMVGLLQTIIKVINVIIVDKNKTPDSPKQAHANYLCSTLGLWKANLTFIP